MLPLMLVVSNDEQKGYVCQFSWGGGADAFIKLPMNASSADTAKYAKASFENMFDDRTAR